MFIRLDSRIYEADYLNKSGLEKSFCINVSLIPALLGVEVVDALAYRKLLDFVSAEPLRMLSCVRRDAI